MRAEGGANGSEKTRRKYSHLIGCQNRHIGTSSSLWLIGACSPGLKRYVTWRISELCKCVATFSDAPTSSVFDIQGSLTLNTWPTW